MVWDRLIFSALTDAPQVHFKRHRFPAEIIAHAGWLFSGPLSLRDVEDLLAERDINVSFQTFSEWAALTPSRIGGKSLCRLKPEIQTEAINAPRNR